ncbi:MAG: hypothetical protein AAB131_16235 [Actinomycetota bacterium]
MNRLVLAAVAVIAVLTGCGVRSEASSGTTESPVSATNVPPVVPSATVLDVPVSDVAEVQAELPPIAPAANGAPVDPSFDFRVGDLVIEAEYLGKDLCVTNTDGVSSGRVCSDGARSGLLLGGSSTHTSPQRSVVYMAHAPDVVVTGDSACRIETARSADGALAASACDVGEFVGDVTLEFTTADGRVFRTTVTVYDFGSFEEV